MREPQSSDLGFDLHLRRLQRLGKSPSEAPFFESIWEAKDDVPLMVFADWLEERGDPRAEYLRLLGRDEHRERLYELAQQIGVLSAISPRLEAGWTVVTLPVLNSTSTGREPSLKDEVLILVGPMAARRLILDLSNVERLGGFGMGALSVAYRHVVHRHHGEIRLCQATPALSQTLRIWQLVPRVFPLMNTLQEALR